MQQAVVEDEGTALGDEVQNILKSVFQCCSLMRN
jgi:hypothetical protein